MFDKFINRYIAKGKIKTQTAIYIGASKTELRPNGIDNQFLKDVEGNPFIPGSSLKGISRSFLERILLAQGEDVCTITNLCSKDFDNKSKRDSILKKLEAKGELDKDNKELSLARYVYDNICIICSLFGSNANAAKVLFRDARVDLKSFRNFEVRNGVSIDRDTNTAVNKALYELEVVPADTEFEFEIVAENLSDAEKEYLLVLLKAMEFGDLQLGGMTSRGLGKFTLKDVTIEEIKPDNLVTNLLKGEKNLVKLDEAITQVGVGGSNV